MLRFNKWNYADASSKSEGLRVYGMVFLPNMIHNEPLIPTNKRED